MREGMNEIPPRHHLVMAKITKRSSRKPITRAMTSITKPPPSTLDISRHQRRRRTEVLITISMPR